MLVIRLFRVGKKSQPSFKIVVTDKRRPPRGGRFVEEVGFWNPLTKEKALEKERIKHWILMGAKPSATVHNLLIKEKVWEGRKIPLHKKKKEKTEEKPKEAPKTEETKTEAKSEEPKVQEEVKEEKPKEEKADKPEEKPEAKEEPKAEEGKT